MAIQSHNICVRVSEGFIFPRTGDDGYSLCGKEFEVVATGLHITLLKYRHSATTKRWNIVSPLFAFNQSGSEIDFVEKFFVSKVSSN